jgi:hypothetical protein
MTYYSKKDQDAKLEKYLKKLIKYENALYDSVSKKPLFILDGCCIKAECKFFGSLGIKKVLLPDSLRSGFRTKIPLERIGKIVVCFCHFFFEDQIFYLKNGYFQAGVQLMRKGENNHESSKTIHANPANIKTSAHACYNDNDWKSHAELLPKNTQDRPPHPEVQPMASSQASPVAGPSGLQSTVPQIPTLPTAKRRR